MAKFTEISFISEHGLKDGVSRLLFSTFLPLRPGLMSFHLLAVHSQELKSQIIPRMFSSTSCVHTDSPMWCLLTYTPFLTLLKTFRKLRLSLFQPLLDSFTDIFASVLGQPPIPIFPTFTLGAELPEHKFCVGFFLFFPFLKIQAKYLKMIGSFSARGWKFQKKSN